MQPKLITSDNQTKLPALIFVGALLLVLIFWLVIPFNENGENVDYLHYYAPVARNIVAGAGITLDGVEIATRYPPGYPLILALVFKFAAWFSLPTQLTLAIFNLLCYGASAVLIFLLASNIWDNKSALISVACWGSYLPLLWLTSQPSSEVPFLVFTYASLYLFYFALQHKKTHFHWYFLSGLCGGCAALIRPNGLLVGAALVLASLFLQTKPIKLRGALIALLLAGNLVVLLPWQSLVYLKTGKVIGLSTGLVPSMRDGLRFAVNPKSYRLDINVPEDVRLLTGRIHTRFDEMDNMRRLISVVAEESSKQPTALLKLLAIKAARSWYATDSGRRETILFLMQLVYLSVLLVGLIGTWRDNTNHRQLLVLVGLLVALFWGVTILVLSILRYMVPVIGLLFVFLPGCQSFLNRSNPART